MEELAKPKKATIRPAKAKRDIEAEYRGFIQGIVREMAADVREHLIPSIKRLKPQYQTDSMITDAWTDDIRMIMEAMRAKWTSVFFRNRVRAAVTRPISMQEASTTSQWLKQVNKSVGVDVSGMMKQAGINDYIQATIQDNVSLVTSVPDQYLKSIENAVWSGMKNGLSPTSIANDIQEATGVSYLRATNIAKDQILKVNSDVSRKRSEDLGIKLYKWSTSKDERVSGNPSGKYPNAKVKCYRISRQDNGYGEGVYSYKRGAEYAGEKGLHPGHAHVNCRCSAIPLIEGVNYDPKAKRMI